MHYRTLYDLKFDVNFFKFFFCYYHYFYLIRTQKIENPLKCFTKLDLSKKKMCWHYSITSNRFHGDFFYSKPWILKIFYFYFLIFLCNFVYSFGGTKKEKVKKWFRSIIQHCNHLKIFCDGKYISCFVYIRRKNSVLFSVNF